MKSLKIENSRPATPKEWDEYWNVCEYSTYFHSREWAEIWCEYMKPNMVTTPMILQFSDSTEILLPVCVQFGFRNWSKTTILSPASTFGGWLSKEPINAEHSACLANFIVNNLGDIEWRTNPYDGFSAGIMEKRCMMGVTNVLDLGLGFETLYRNWKKGRGMKITKAKREGVLVRGADGYQDWMQYYKIYEDSLRRWGDTVTSRYGFDLFSIMLARKSANIILWLAMLNEEPISGMLCFYSKRHVANWHSSTLSNYFNLRPSSLLIYEAVKDACLKGYRWFDFNPSGGHKGVQSFKEGFGTEQLKTGIYIRKSLKSKGIDKFLKAVSLFRKEFLWLKR